MEELAVPLALAAVPIGDEDVGVLVVDSTLLDAGHGSIIYIKIRQVV